ncbi:MAG: FMN-binding protein [Bacilli bacterium]
MKKGLLILVGIFGLFITGCAAEKGEYKEGLYFGFDADNGVTATVSIDANGNIAGVMIDSAYHKDCKIVDDKASCTDVTKRMLGEDYNMAREEGQLEWYEQADAFAKRVVKDQNLDFVEYKYRKTEEDGSYVFYSTAEEEDTKEDKIFMDSVSGVTITVDGMYNAVNNALKNAK